MDIINRAVGADRHSKDGRDQLGPALLIENRDRAHGRQCARGQPFELRMRSKATLDDERRTPRAQPADQLAVTQPMLAVGPGSTCNAVPSLRAPTTTSFE